MPVQHRVTPPPLSFFDQARLLTLHCASKIDELGAKAARNEIGMIKVQGLTQHIYMHR